MLRYLFTGWLTRGASRRVARLIPNPLLRTLAIAATGYAANRVLTTRRMGPANVGTPTMPRRRGLLRFG